MEESIFTILIGVVCIVLGCLHRKGNIALLHSYHRNRVKEEDKIPFGKLVGLGVIIVGIALIIFGALSLMATVLQQELYLTIGYVVLIVGLIVGLGFSFYAMKKYNNGIL